MTEEDPHKGGAVTFCIVALIFIGLTALELAMAALETQIRLWLWQYVWYLVALACGIFGFLLLILLIGDYMERHRDE